MLACSVWMIPFRQQAWEKKRGGMWRKIGKQEDEDREGAGTNVLCFFWQGMEYLCSVAQQNRAA